MRKSEQRKILELLKTIKQVQSVGLYADCQQGAASIGSYIECIEGTGTHTVGLLEEYCELLFGVHNGEIQQAQLEKCLIKIIESVHVELKPNRTQIVFLSYKASMSDSLESIYLAAKEDPSCEAYWVPIPYFEKEADGSFGTMHYEGAESYPKHVECTDWQKYDIETQHPDVIFTNNPYDAQNFITSVHPHFYCERLRKFTDLLVYVPYFMSFDDIQDAFCLLPGCVFAHKVVVQSDRIRDIYVRIFGKAYKNKYGKPENKFIALGSPKIDKVVNSNREDFTLPNRWRELIIDKRVILYNSSITEFLKNDAQYLKKMCRIIAGFRGRDDVVLWWRPHPLSQSTYKSMRPHLLNEYQQLINKYRREDWGIFDDTPDLHRAIAWSDGYYGDMSSVLLLYLATNKPAMLGDTRFLSDVFHALPGGMCISQDSIWFSTRYVNALFRVNKLDSNAEFVGEIPDEKRVQHQAAFSLYGSPAENGGCIYFPPQRASEIAIYSTQSNTFEKIPYNHSINGKELCGAFADAIAYKHFVFFSPYRYPAIIRLDTQTKEITRYTDWVEPIERLTNSVLDKFFAKSLVVGNTLWLASCRANAVVAFDMDLCQSIIYKVGEKGYRYCDMCFDGENYWLLPYPGTDTPLVKWNPATNMLYKLSEIHNRKIDEFFYSIFYRNGHIWLWPSDGCRVCKIDILTNAVSVIQVCKPSNDSTQSDTRYGSAQISGDIIYAYCEQSGALIQYNTASNEFRKDVIRYTPEIDTKLKPFSSDTGTMRTLYDCYYKESSVVRLADYINYVVAENDNAAIRQRRKEIMQFSILNSDGTAGQTIYGFVKSVLL